MANGRTSKEHLTQDVFLFRNAIGILPTARPAVYSRLPFSIVLCTLTVTRTVTLNQPYSSRYSFRTVVQCEKKGVGENFCENTLCSY